MSGARCDALVGPGCVRLSGPCSGPGRLRRGAGMQGMVVVAAAEEEAASVVAAVVVVAVGS